MPANKIGTRGDAAQDRSPRILIVRLSAIGDVIQSTPLASALRERFPNAWISWVVGAAAAPILEGHPAIDDVIPVRRNWLKSPSAVWAIRRYLKSFQFDVAIDGQGLTKAAILSWLSGAKRRIGFGNPWGRELSQWFNSETVDTLASHVVDRNMELLAPLGIKRPRVQFELSECRASAQVAERIISDAGLQSGYAIINVGAGWPSKLWPTDRYVAVARHLRKNWNLQSLVLWFGDEERRLASEVIAGSAESSVLAPLTTLPELAALARRAQLFIGSDTGPLHLSAAVDTPCVGLYGPWPADRHGPYGEKHIAIQKRTLEGRVGTRDRRYASPEYMAAISVGDVCEACDEILGCQGLDSVWRCAEPELASR
jgi:heptosyltransferase-1